MNSFSLNMSFFGNERRDHEKNQSFDEARHVYLKQHFFIFSGANPDHFLISDREGAVTVFNSCNLQKIAHFPATSSWSVPADDDRNFAGFVRVSDFLKSIKKIFL